MAGCVYPIIQSVTYCAIQYNECNTLDQTRPHCNSIVHYMVVCTILLYDIVLHYTTLYYDVLQHITIILDYIVLHFIILSNKEHTIQYIIYRVQ